MRFSSKAVDTKEEKQGWGWFGFILGDLKCIEAIQVRNAQLTE
jgi:hypothetical protein